MDSTVYYTNGEQDRTPIKGIYPFTQNTPYFMHKKKIKKVKKVITMIQSRA
jgi:hypothetical protein